MERHRLLGYLTTRLSLLEAWQKIYSEYAPGDPELTDAVENYMTQVQILDESEMLEWDKMGNDDTNDIQEKRRGNKLSLENIYKLHRNHQSLMKNFRESLILEMKGVRKAKALSNQILATSEDYVSKLDTQA